MNILEKEGDYVKEQIEVRICPDCLKMSEEALNIRPRNVGIRSFRNFLESNYVLHYNPSLLLLESR